MHDSQTISLPSPIPSPLPQGSVLGPTFTITKKCSAQYCVTITTIRRPVRVLRHKLIKQQITVSVVSIRDN